MPDSILFLTLRVFSATGGIEKMCRVIGKALYEKSIIGKDAIDIYSSHDHTADADGNAYFPSEQFRGFGNNKWRFLAASIRRGMNSHTVMMSHINLLPAGWLIKRMAPKTRIILMVHGIEVWDMPLGYRRYLLDACDTIICVSEYTRKKMLELHGLAPDRCVVLNNCLDPYLPDPVKGEKGRSILKEIGLAPEDTIMFTLARMRSSERYKGYDRVIRAMASLKDEFPHLKYVIGGRADHAEEAYIHAKVKECRLEGRVLLPGFIKNEELSAYFAAMDFYIMPSTGEGFGIVFVEAMYYGLPVIAGNRDGSADAVDQGRLGLLADPDSEQSVASAIRTMMHSRETIRPERQMIEARFGYPAYRSRLFDLLRSN